MLPLRLFRDRTFATANVATSLRCVGFFGVVFLLRCSPSVLPLPRRRGDALEALLVG